MRRMSTLSFLLLLPALTGFGPPESSKDARPAALDGEWELVGQTMRRRGVNYELICSLWIPSPAPRISIKAPQVNGWWRGTAILNAGASPKTLSIDAAEE